MNAQCHACIGGTNVREDIRKLEMGVHIVVGTPGRVYDMITRRALRKYFTKDSLRANNLNDCCGVRSGSH